MKKILYIHPDETIAYLIDRIENTDSDTLYIATDANPGLFTDSVNLKLLKRESDSFNKNCIIVSQDRFLLEQAKNAGFDISSEDLSSADSPAPAAEENTIQHSALAINDQDDDEIEIPVRVASHSHLESTKQNKPDHFTLSEMEEDTDDFASSPVISEDNEEEQPEISRRMPFSKIKIAGFTALCIALLFGLSSGLFSVFSAKLSARITPKKETVHYDFRVVADSTLSVSDIAKTRIPGQIIKSEKETTDVFTASGTQDKESKASGEIVIYNEFGVVAQTLVKSTRFKSKDGKIFRLTETIVVPGAKKEAGKLISAGTARAMVVADQAGASYNIDPGDFSVPGFAGTPKFLGFYAKSEKPFSGGGSSNARFATREDLDKAKAVLQEKRDTALQEHITATIPKGLKTIPQAYTQDASQFSADPVHEKNGTFTAKLKTSYTIFAFSEDDIAELAERALADKVSRERKTAQGTRVISYADGTIGSDKKTLSFTVKVSELVMGIIDVKQLQSMLAGKNEAQIRELLGSQESIENAEITFWPLWVSQAPHDPEKITVSVNES